MANGDPWAFDSRSLQRIRRSDGQGPCPGRHEHHRRSSRPQEDPGPRGGHPGRNPEDGSKGPLLQHERRRSGKTAEALDAVHSAFGEAGGGNIKAMLHSLAFGTLRLYIADDPSESLNQKQMEMTLDVMAHSLVYWTQDIVHRGLMGKGGKVFAMTSEGGTGSSPLWRGLRREGRAGIPHPPTGRRAGAARHHRQLHPRGRDGHTGLADDSRP